MVNRVSPSTESTCQGALVSISAIFRSAASVLRDTTSQGINPGCGRALDSFSSPQKIYAVFIAKRHSRPLASVSVHSTHPGCGSNEKDVIFTRTPNIGRTLCRLTLTVRGRRSTEGAEAVPLDRHVRNRRRHTQALFGWSCRNGIHRGSELHNYGQMRRLERSR
jgi:hypothetical protein